MENSRFARYSETGTRVTDRSSSWHYCLGKIFGLANIWRLSTAPNHCAPLYRLLLHLMNSILTLTSQKYILQRMLMQICKQAAYSGT